MFVAVHYDFMDLHHLINKMGKRSDNGSSIPEFCDSKGVNYHTGLSRSHLYALANEGKIKTVSLQKTGSTRGKRLWHLPSILTYLKSIMEGDAK